MSIISSIKSFFQKVYKSIFPGKETVNIVILGDKGCGKTELWCRLQGKKNTENGGTSKERIDSFTLGKNPSGDNVVVQTSKDIGGGDNWVKDYDELVNCNGTFIYYLVELTRLDYIAEDTRNRLRKIKSIERKKKLKDCGIRILATFFDKYDGDKDKAIKDVKEKIFNKRIMGIEITPQMIQPINTTDWKDINEIKQQILKSVGK